MAGIGMLGPVLANAAKQVTAKKLTQDKMNPSPFKKKSKKMKKAKGKAKKVKKVMPKKAKTPPFMSTGGMARNQGY